MGVTGGGRCAAGFLIRTVYLVSTKNKEVVRLLAGDGVFTGGAAGRGEQMAMRRRLS